jgi:hypothetical protein
MIIRPTYINKEHIFSQISQKEVFEKYLGINISKLLQGDLFCNPLRKDSFPTCSFKVYKNPSYPEGVLIYFRDWADSKGYDCIGFVSNITGLNYLDTLCLISKHFNLLSGEDVDKYKYILDVEAIKSIAKVKTKAKLAIKSIPFSKEHVKFFKQYHLDIEDLGDDIKAIKCFWINETRFNPKDIAFAYCFGNGNYKIYCPYANREKGEIKFVHNNSEILQGQNSLNFEKSNLIITSSYKDVKLLNKIIKIENLDFEVCATMSESTPPTEKAINFLKSKYQNIIIYYNNDEAGIKAAITQSEIYNLMYIYHDLSVEEKDITDYAKIHGLENAINLFKELLNL